MIPRERGGLNFDGYIEGVGGFRENVEFTREDAEYAAVALIVEGFPVPSTSQAAIIAAAYRLSLCTPVALELRPRSTLYLLEE